jgi:hypothetical protein
MVMTINDSDDGDGPTVLNSPDSRRLTRAVESVLVTSRPALARGGSVVGDGLIPRVRWGLGD